MKLKYYDFADSIDVDAFEEAIEFDVLSQHNGEDIGKCPDLWGLHSHGDQTGKFAINREKKVWHCFVCEGGNLLTLAMAWLDADEYVATEWLYQFAKGDSRPDADFVADLKNLLDRYEAKGAERLPYFNERVLDKFIAGQTTAEFEAWRRERGISLETAVWHSLGYSDNQKKPAPMKGGEKIDDDYFGPCIIIPHFWAGRLVGWQHRWLNFGVDTPIWLGKYTNTGDFPKGETLYNYDLAIKAEEPVIVVESVPTVLFLETLGIPAISTFGAEVRPGQFKWLCHFRDLIAAPDNDKAGRKFTDQILSNRVEGKVRIIPPLPGAKSDLGDLAKVAHPLNAVLERISSATYPEISEV